MPKHTICGSVLTAMYARVTEIFGGVGESHNRKWLAKRLANGYRLSHKDNETCNSPNIPDKTI